MADIQDKVETEFQAFWGQILEKMIIMERSSHTQKPLE